MTPFVTNKFWQNFTKNAIRRKKRKSSDFFVCFLDILLNFRTTFVNHKGEVVTNSKDITINYIKTWFFLDLVAALPFDFLELFELNLMVSSSFK